jgi:hypothetical protein
MTKSVDRISDLIAADRKVSLEGICALEVGGHGSKALSRPMREDSPAARISPAKLDACAMLRKIAESCEKVSDGELLILLLNEDYFEAAVLFQKSTIKIQPSPR